MNVEVTSEEVHYTITYDELCKMFKIPDADRIDFLEVKIDEHNEKIILSQIEPSDISRPKGDNEK